MDSETKSILVGARVVLSDGQGGTVTAIGASVQVELDSGRTVDVDAGALALEPTKPVIGPGSGYPDNATPEQILGNAPAASGTSSASAVPENAGTGTGAGAVTGDGAAAATNENGGPTS